MKKIGKKKKTKKKTKQIHDPILGYQTSIRLIALVSSEIYSRFSAMLTANSIIVAIIGWMLTNEHPFSQFLMILLPLVGLVLCIMWMMFVIHGVYWQHLFREEAKRLERLYFSDTFELILLVDTEDLQNKKQKKKNHLENHPWWVRWFPFYRPALCVILVFVIIYETMFFYQLFSLILIFKFL